jgi:flagellar hook-associated protein FlgK
VTDLLSIGASATQLYRVALGTVSNNIANLNNEAYSRQEIAISDNAPARIGVLSVGSGARLDAIRRNYDEFVEGSLRQSNSALQMQQPLIDYTQRIMDVIAAEDGSLTMAVDRFFTSLNRLELDPSSISSRNELLASGQFLAGRVRSLGSELADIETESALLLQDQIDSVNTLARSLLEVNRQLDRVSNLQKQSSQLLDQRDKLLRELSQYASVSVTENSNGSVQVRLAGTATRGLLVDSVAARTMDVNFAEDGNRQGFILDKYGSPSNIGQLQGGSLAGLVVLRDQLLEPLAGELDYFATTFVTAANAEHRAGLDLDNQLGEDLFSIVPRHVLLDTGGNLADGLQARTLEGNTAPLTLQLTFMGEGRWLVQDLAADSSRVMTESETPNGLLLRLGSVEVAIVGPQSVGASVVLKAASRPAQDMILALDDPRMIASAGRLGVRQDPDNSRSMGVQLSYGESANSRPDLPGISLEYVQNRNLVSSLPLNGSSPVVSIPRGMGEFTVGFMAPLDGSADFQVISSKFALLASSGAVPAGWIDALSANGRYANFLPESSSLNQDYPGTDLFIGARAEGTLESERLPAPTQASRFDAGELVLNGVALGALDLPANSDNLPALVGAWINTHTGATGVSAEAVNLIRVAPGQLAFEEPLRINGSDILAAGRSDVLVNNINARTADTGVRAYLDTEGYLHLTNVKGQEGQRIVLGNGSPGTNTLGVPDGTYNGSLRFSTAAGAGISFTLGSTGRPSDLSRIGLATTVTGTNPGNEDLHVYLTGTPRSIDVRIQAAALPPPPPRTLEPPFRVEFVESAGELRYRLIDTGTATVLHQSRFDFAAGIVHGDVRVRFDLAPQAGDVFEFVPNLDALGDNNNLRRLAALENQSLFRGQTMRAFYVNEINKIGTASQLADMTASADEIVYNESLEKRASVSGVNLDQEAADLIRFQQAFQAAAQVIQVASRLFDALLAVR